MATDDETGDFSLVRQDPAAWYRDPQAIVDDPRLSRGEKEDLLAEWALDVADRNAAADEGMVPEKPGMIDRDVSIQDKVAAAQAVLAPDDSGMTFAARLWQRITG